MACERTVITAEKCEAKHANKRMRDKENIDEQGWDLALA